MTFQRQEFANRYATPPTPDPMVATGCIDNGTSCCHGHYHQPRGARRLCLSRLCEKRQTSFGAVQKLSIEEIVKRDFYLILDGVDVGLRKPGTNEPITTESNCRDFLDAMRERLASYRNPFDGSPAVTFWSGYSYEQAQGKLRFTCYRFHGADTDNGGSCKMNQTGIRMTYFRLPCGGVCGAQHCIYSSADCGGATGKGWVHHGQVDKTIGTVEYKYVRLPNGRRARFPNGDLKIDPIYSRQVCPGFSYGRIPRKADY